MTPTQRYNQRFLQACFIFILSKKQGKTLSQESKLSGTALKATTWSLPPSMSHSKPGDTAITCYLPEKRPQYLSVTTKLNLWCRIHHTWQTHILMFGIMLSSKTKFIFLENFRRRRGREDVFHLDTGFLLSGRYL